MGNTKPSALYGKMVQVTRVYLGPSADRFISRQVESHIGKAPNDFTAEDLDTLIIWIKVAISVITDDNDIIDEYIGQLRQLARNSRAA